MLPTQERLVADDTVVREPDDRLVVEDELLLLEGLLDVTAK
jgi:hypothetical protein